MAGLFKKRKGKEVASSSEGIRFKTPYHEAHFNSKLSSRKILPELIIQVDRTILDPCAFQIENRKWERLTNPIQAVGQNMVREFYANAWEPEKEKRKPYTYTTMVRGKEISFAPQDIKRVLRLRKDPLPNAASYEERVANKDYRLDHVQEDLCIEGGELAHHANHQPFRIIGRKSCTHPLHHHRRKHQCGRIAKQFYKFIYKTDLASSLPFPSIIAALCADAKIYRRLDQQQEESRKSFEAINTRMDRMDDQLSFLCYSNQMVNETMYYPYQNTARQFREMEAQGVPVTIANLAIHRHIEEEMNRERMGHNQTVQEAAAERAREANKGKAREVVPDSEVEESEEMYSSPSEEWIVLLGHLFLVGTIPTSPWYYLYDAVHLPRSERITMLSGPNNMKISGHSQASNFNNNIFRNSRN
ncbi:hypothetical protein PIB30_054581 [Stylosanthes scabra]|uniref:Putative plant transposon protein domain-containing protein n=1 Tax=Stylosanthes scabra TaxID=79078 RepID=A0ABU6WKT5_9FABA|nr:hypothetical protein [Stylosanthes scabra]